MRWAARLIRSALLRKRPARCSRPRLSIQSLEPREVPHTTGFVFLDSDGDGTFDTGETGVPGVTVSATGATSVQTAADGSYNIATPDQLVRLEFSNLPTGVLTGRVTAASGPLVRFYDATSHPTDVNLALNPVLVATSQLNYDAADGVNTDAATLVSLDYGSDGSVTSTELAITSAVGSTWGLAYQGSSNSLFAAAFLKRHSGMGPSGTGAIYKITPVPGGTPVVSLLIDLNAEASIDTGADPRTGTTDFDVDGTAYPLVGKVGLGGIALSADGRTLFAINLNSREIIEIPLTAAGAVDTSTAITTTPTPTGNPTGSGIATADFAAADMRPFAVTVRNGVVFVGVTYTGETNNRDQDVRAFVYAYDPATNSFRAYNQATGAFSSDTLEPVLSVDLTYARPTIDPNPDTPTPGAVSADWGAWSGTFPAGSADADNVMNPQPWLTGLAFDGNNIVLGVRDRFGDQTGYANRAPDSTQPTDPTFFGVAVGDVLRASPSGAGWVLQAGGGGGEFYTGDSAGTDLPEVSTGAVAQVPGFGTVAMTGNNPDAATPFSGGIYTLSNTSGAAVNRAELYQSTGFDTFGNANGLGGLVAFAASSAIQAGDRVFEDTNNNGIQDPTEPGIAGVAVGLFLNGTQVGSNVTTDANGAFVFDNLQPNTTYEMRFDRTQTALTNRSLATANQGSNDQLDSDVMAGTGNTAVIAFTTGLAGDNVHALDAGFQALAAPGPLTLGGTIWRDADNDGVKDTGEPGIPNVLVELLDGAGAPTGDTVLTGSGGDYTFSNIAAGTYRVRLATSNFQSSGALVNTGSSGVTDANADNNEDDDDNGIVTGTLSEAGGFVASGTVTLTAGQEPTGGGNSNTTVDFGITPTSTATTLTIGDAVFLDANDNGTFDTGEAGVPNVLLELLDQNGQPTGATATTNASGVFTFANLAAGSYQVRIAASNFSGSGALVGFTSSTSNVTDPENNVNGDDNGSVFGVLGSGGTITSGTIILALGTEPTDDGDGDVNTNKSLDFGVRSVATGGTLSIGSTVWNDVNNNGLLDTGETGIDGVTVQLLNSSGNVINSTTTANGGTYAFTGLAAGDYTVRLAATNFNVGNALAGFTSSTGTNGALTGAFEGTATPDPDSDTDNDDNGQVTGTLGSGGTIGAAAITLAVGQEPGTSDTNNTLDFGLFRKQSIGNVVFNDADNSGALNGTETGIAGVTVRLLDATGTTQIATTTTSPNGQYLFTNLAPGDYVVEIADTNFIGTGVLAGFTSSTGTNNAFEGTNTPDPDTVATDADDNGTTTGTLGQAGGVIRSAPVTLSIAGEPVNESPNNDPTASDANSNLTVDFGVRLVAATGTLTLGDQVFVDTNNNGTKDTAETGLGGVSLQLLNGQGQVIRTAVTDSQGNYRFTNLAAGDYQVQIAATNFQAGGILVGYTSSTSTSTDPDNNSNNNDDGAAVGTLGQPNGVIRSGFITLTLDQEPTNDGDNDNDTNLTLDFGVVAPVQRVTLGGTIYTDANNNGVQDTTETGIPGVTVQLLNSSGAVVTSGTTDSSGNYSFANLTAGDYRVRLVNTNFQGTGPLSGFTSSTGTVGSPSGQYEGSAAADPDNNINGDDNGQIGGILGQNTGVIDSGLITLSLGQEPTNDGDTDNNTNLSLDFGVFKALTVGDTVFNDLNNNGTKDTNEPGIPGVTVRVLNAAGTATASVLTNAQGVYSIGFLPAGTYTIELSSPNFNAGGPLFGFTSSTGTGNAFEPAPTTATNNQDHGTITGTLGSGGSIRSGTVTLGTANDQSIDFGVFQQNPGSASIAGQVFRDFNNDGKFNVPDTGISGVTITLTGGSLSSPLTLTTDNNGNFKFTNLAAGTYTITETQPTTPANQTGKDVAGSAGGNVSVANTISGIVLGANTQATNYRFAEVPLISTAGSVFEDVNNNGQKDAGEVGVPNVTVVLTGTSVVTGQAISPITVTTDASGNYTFPNLVPGVYTITETQPTGYFDGKEQNGTPAATVGSDKFKGIDLTKSAATSSGFNFGEQKASSIAGVVFKDTNNSGVQDTGETGIGGVTIKLTGNETSGKKVNLTATTTADGTYSFTNLRAGTYTVTETQPAGFVDGQETVGTAGGAVQQDKFAGIPLQSGVTATAYRFAELEGPDLQITETHTQRSINRNGTVTITYTVKNIGTVAAAGTTATLAYTGLTFVSADPTADYSDTTKIWTIGDLAPNASKTLAITLRGTTNGTFNTTATAATTTSPEGTPSNNSVALKVFVGTTNPDPGPGPGPGPVTPPPPPTSLWFLSSGTNARRR